MGKAIYLVLGWLCIAVGVIGVFLPVLPTTPFILLAAFLFSKGSPRLHQWIVSHPTFGPPITDWNENGVINPRAKFVATLMILASFSWITFLTAAPLPGKIILDLIGASVLVFIWSRPSAKVDR